MSSFDRRFLNPGPEALIDALVEATHAANYRARIGRLVAPRQHFAAFLSEDGGAPEGAKRWLEGRVVNNEIAEDRATLVALVWWTDRIGRRHARVVSRRVERGKEFHETRFGTLHEERPPLWLIYPERVFLRTVGGRRDVIAVCGCGACGTVDSLGWMGDRCAACHDRGEEGSVVEQPPCPSAATMYGHQNAVKFVAFSTGGETLVSVSHDTNLRFWDVATGAQRVSRQPKLGVLGVSMPVASNGREVVIRNYGGSGRWAVATGETIQVDRAQWDNAPSRLALSSDGKEAHLGNDHLVSVLDLSAEITTPRTIGSEGQVAAGLAFSPDGQYLAIGQTNGLVDLIHEGTGSRQVFRTGSTHAVRALIFDAEGRRLAFEVGSLKLSGSVWIDGGDPLASTCRVGWWDRTSGAEGALPQPVTWINAIAFSPDGTWLASAHADCSVSFWDLAQRLVKLEWHVGAVNSLAFSPNGQLLATGSADGTVKFWPWRRLLEA